MIGKLTDRQTMETLANWPFLSLGDEPYTLGLFDTAGKNCKRIMLLWLSRLIVHVCVCE